MKFSVTFAILAAFVANKAVVSAAPTPAYDIDLRAEPIEAAEGVWERFYTDLLDEFDARDYEEDYKARGYDEDPNTRDFGDEDIFERSSTKMIGRAKTLYDIASGWKKQHDAVQSQKRRNSRPGFASIVKQAVAANKKPAAPPVVRPVQAPADSKWNTLKKPGVLDHVRALGKPSFVFQKLAKGAFGKKRSLNDIEEILFERAPMKKFATHLATGLAQKAPTYAKQYTQTEEAKRRNAATPRMASVVQQAMAANKAPTAKPPSFPKIPAASKWNTVKKPSVMEEIKKLGKK